MKKSVMQFYVLFFLLVALLAVSHYVHFGGFTGYALVKRNSQSTAENSEFDDSEIESSVQRESSLYWLAPVILALLALFFVARFVQSHYNRTRKMPYVKSGGERHLIELNLKYGEGQKYLFAFVFPCLVNDLFFGFLSRLL